MSRREFYIGDPVPKFTCRSTNNPTFNFDSAAGRYLVLMFFGTFAAESSTKAIEYVTGILRQHFDDKKVSFFGVSIDPDDEKEERVKELNPGIRYFWDFDRTISTGFGAIDPEHSVKDGQLIYHGFTLVIDPFLRVIGNISLNDFKEHNQALKNLIEKLPSIDRHAGITLHAPVLILPRVFEPEFCQKLIALYEQNGGNESGFMREKEGNTVGVIDYGFKRRKDFNFDDNPEYEDLRSAIKSRISRRLTPAIYKSFQFNATFLERYLVACYEGEVGGFFRPHRDNTTKATAHRQFACTINLNTKEYEGGDLRFPEFGTRTYRAPTGGAIVFSCSLLHEATPVTKGKRYAFIPFLYDDKAQVIRDKNRKFLKEEIINRNSN